MTTDTPKVCGVCNKPLVRGDIYLYRGGLDAPPIHERCAQDEQIAEKSKMTTDTPRTDEKEGVYQMRRDVLRPTGIVPADFARTLERDLSAMRERVVKYRARLEIDHHAEDFGGTLERVDLPFDEDEPYDGIECRDATIRLLDQARDEMRTDLSECRAALAERQAAIDAIVRCDMSHTVMQTSTTLIRLESAIDDARALATKEPQS